MKILVVDDERDVRLLFEQRFRKEIRNNEMHFVFAYSGEEALVYLKELRSRSELIVHYHPRTPEKNALAR